MIVRPDGIKRYILSGTPSRVLDSSRQPVTRNGTEEWRYPVVAISAGSPSRELFVKASPASGTLEEGAPVRLQNLRAFVWITDEGRQALSWRADAVEADRPSSSASGTGKGGAAS